MDRFFADSIDGNRAIIDTKEEMNHITKTLRMKVGDLVELIDGEGEAFSASICSIEKDEIVCDIISQLPSNGELSTAITVYQGIPKSQKMDFIVQKLTEIGVQRIVPVSFERCVKQIGEKEDKLIARWNKIALEAVKQSKRTRIPIIERSLSFVELLEDIKKNHRTFLCYENEKNKTLKQALKEESAKDIECVGVLIGPEGGITEKESQLLIEAGAISVLIGKSILRTETAALVGASILAYELE